MSDTAATTPAAEAAPKKSKLLLILIIVAVVAVLGGGGVFFLRRGSTAEAAKAEKSKKSAKEKNSAADDEAAADEPVAEEKSSRKKSGGAKIDLPDDSNVKKVIELSPFIVNLANKGEANYLRMSVSLGVGESKGEEKPDPLLTTRVRNALLAVLTTKTSDEVLTVEGKTALRKELLRAARAAVEEPRIEAIYITDFIVQIN